MTSETAPSIVVVSTYPPTRCGLASYSASLIRGLAAHRASSAGLHVARVLCEGDEFATDPRVISEFDPASPSAVATAAARISRHDVAFVQHEFGIYGPDDGTPATELMERIGAPIVTTLHTVAERQSAARARIVTELASLSTRVVVTIPLAAERLVERHGVPADKTVVIPHGSHWEPAVAADVPRDRTILLTWGLISPPKGIQHAIAALPDLRDYEPLPLYWIQGATHPVIRRREGEAYRAELKRMAGDLGVADMVHFDERYLPNSELAGLVKAAAVIVLPYEEVDHVSSGVLAEAVAMGRPVVATAFSHAREVRGARKGLVLVDPADPGQIAKAVFTVLEDPEHRLAAAERRRDAPTWEAVAAMYEGLAVEIAGKKELRSESPYQTAPSKRKMARSRRRAS